MSTLTRRGYRGPIGSMVDWLEAPWTALRPVSLHPIRVEDLVRDGKYVVRAEIPGIDPESDLEVTVGNGNLTIKADRREEINAKHHSEFRYGSFTRSVTLPPGADEEHINASYGNGILEVSVKLSGDGEDNQVRRVRVKQNDRQS
jgi:HSP20 family protein